MIDDQQLTPAEQEELKRMTLSTGNDLRTIARNIADQKLSMLSLPEMDAVVDVIARVIPAGNVPGLIASGLARLESNAPSKREVKRDIGMIFRGMNQMFDKALYRGLFELPARVIWGYQHLLKLTGKDLDAAFPEGTWQFYVDYALREDTARHANETSGFDQALHDYQIQLDELDRIVAWVMTAIETLHNYPRLLENEWRERVYIRKVIELSDDEQYQAQFASLYSNWLKVLPYHRIAAEAHDNEDYPDFRHRKFDEWLFQQIRTLPRKRITQLIDGFKQAKQTELQAYIDQMSILGYLDAETYGEVRVSLPINDLHVGLIYQDHYYLIPACQPHSARPADVQTVRGQVAAIFENPSEAPAAELQMFAQILRKQWPQLGKKLPQKLIDELDKLRRCPIMLNFDPRDRRRPLAEIRQTERGIGDHALTIFDTRESFVFDQSHIYFDGAWGAALAEIMTNEALSWAFHLYQQAAPKVGHRPYTPQLIVSPGIREHLVQLDQSIPEVSAENESVRLEFVMALRRIFKQRNDLLQMTVNDLLVLFRAIHAISYQADPALVRELHRLQSDNFSREAAETALQALEADQRPPTILIPVDASQNSPRDRLYPMSFDVPVLELNLLRQHNEVMAALEDYEERRSGSGEVFDKLQREYLASLAGFGQVMSKAKEIANAGQSGSVGTIKLLAHVPPPLQRLMNEIPGRFDMLNDIIKGREVFSNVGRVAKSSTLRRFITAKDDNEKKTLAWGILSDADGVMRISLRDFRPHVGMLLRIGQYELAQAITQDYLDTFATGFNRYLADVQQITLKSRETRMFRE